MRPEPTQLPETPEGELVDKTLEPGWMRATPFWAISASLHLVLLLLLLAIPLAAPSAPQKTVAIQIKQHAKQPEYRPEPERAMKSRPEILDPRKVEKPVIQRKVETVTTEIPKGTPDQLTNVNLRADAINTAIGVSGGPAGQWGLRGHGPASINEGGSKATEKAVRAALEWLRRHQHPEGHWSASSYTEQCKTPCQSENFDRYGPDRGFKEHGVGVTALAMLAFTGYGHTHRDGKHPEYVECLRKATIWLKD